MTAESSFGALPKLMCWLMPIPLTTLWSAGNLTAHGTMDGVGMLENLIPTTFQAVIILAVIALFSVILIDYMYKKRGDE
jgi:bacitracin transport system permease protein